MSQKDYSNPLSRRSLIKGAGATAVGVSLASVLAACGSGSSTDSGGTGGAEGSSGSEGSGGGGTNEKVSLGSNRSNDVDKEALKQVIDAYEGGEVEVNTTESEAYQEAISSYLQGKPDPAFIWFAGFRMQFFASQGLATPIDDVWEDIGDGMSNALAKQSTGADGKKYFVPFYNYPWAVYYKPSVWRAQGYEAPTTFEEWITLNEKMKADGITPIAFADKDGWPVMGTFDYINMRSNGLEFHQSLMAGNESWESDEVKNVFATWTELFPFYQENPLGRTWEEGAQALSSGEAGQYVIGQFVTGQMDDPEDLDFFPFPEINSEFGQDDVEAPIDGFMLSKDQADNESAKNLLRYLGSAEAGSLYSKVNPGWLAVHNDAETSTYSALDAKGAELIRGAKGISQFMDRDTRPDFSSTVMIPSLQEFIKDPKNIDSILSDIEKQKKEIFSS